MKKLFGIFCVFVATIVLGGCNPSSTNPDDQPTPFEGGVYVLCEGSFGSGNASLWHYNPDTKTVTPDVFGRVNNAMLGDVGQSMYLYNNTLFVVVNNSGVVYALDANTGEVLGLIDGLTSPRFVAIDGSGAKGYISQMYTNKLITFDPRTLAKTGEVILDGVVSSEQMAIVGDKLFVASWSNDHKITVLNTTTDKQLTTFTVGVQPYSLALDNRNNLWVVCDGGNAWSSLPEGVEVEAPSLWKINTENYKAEKIHTFASGSYFRSRLAMNGGGDTLYFISDAVWAVDVATGNFPSEPLLSVEGYGQYGLDVNPYNGDLYIADAKDYVSNGAVLRYDSTGKLLDEFEVGLLPSKFIFLAK
ncbi:MAG: YncE family protein [Tidjanibacter sp.]|nr:YncE family protein [Tidjanibacter sp.]